MTELLFATTNQMKLLLAKTACQEHGITIQAKPLDIPEIQSANPREIVLDKAIKAYEIVRQPVLVGDDSWSIPALNGFPGAYMHQMNNWLSSDDWLNLTRPLTDKQVFMTQLLAYTDGSETKIFENTVEGRLLDEVRGAQHMGARSVISFLSDNGQSISEVYESEEQQKKQNREATVVYAQLAAWLKDRSK